MIKKSLRGFECLCCCLQCSAEEQPDEQEEGSWQPGRPSSISFTAARRTCLLPGSYQVVTCWAGCSSALSLDFCFVFLTLQTHLHLEDSVLGSLQSGITEHVAAMEGKCCGGKWILHNQDLVLLFW